ncbi:HAD family hydrolase [Veronia pacifica]|uniref:HAD family hydrolase n=1 Tax=Veronia pacifica TaxID=1080227 RepID=A0A1C3EKU5_9GAMM|nr:HAD-IA family hydrolase [Veronia pacifica]ODA33861.1 hypothetical protein A8L45_08525 [Veronia pacifica]
MIKTVFIDFDGVLRHWSKHDIKEAEATMGLPDGVLYRYAFKPDHLLPTITGKQSHNDWIVQVEKAISYDFDLDSAIKMTQAWMKAGSFIDRSFLNRIKATFPEADFVLITNATDKLDEDLATNHLLYSFNMIINSSSVGVAKPDIEIFKYALEATKTAPEHAVFIDDSHENIMSAEKLGILGVHHTDPIRTLTMLNAIKQSSFAFH